MVDVSIVNKTSPEANWNRRGLLYGSGGGCYMGWEGVVIGEQDHVLSQADALTKKKICRLY